MLKLLLMVIFSSSLNISINYCVFLDDDDDDEDEDDLEDRPTSYAGLSLLGLRNFFSRFFQ